MRSMCVVSIQYSVFSIQMGKRTMKVKVASLISKPDFWILNSDLNTEY